MTRGALSRRTITGGAAGVALALLGPAVGLGAAAPAASVQVGDFKRVPEIEFNAFTTRACGISWARCSAALSSCGVSTSSSDGVNGLVILTTIRCCRASPTRVAKSCSAWYGMARITTSAARHASTGSVNRVTSGSAPCMTCSGKRLVSKAHTL